MSKANDICIVATTAVASLIAQHARSSYKDRLQIECMVVLAEAQSEADLSAKWGFIIEHGLLDEQSRVLARLVTAILQCDVDRIGVSIPELEAEGIVAKTSAMAA